jgi:hypothetical protein
MVARPVLQRERSLLNALFEFLLVGDVWGTRLESDNPQTRHEQNTFPKRSIRRCLGDAAGDEEPVGQNYHHTSTVSHSIGWMQTFFFELQYLLQTEYQRDTNMQTRSTSENYLKIAHQSKRQL